LNHGAVTDHSHNYNHNGRFAPQGVNAVILAEFHADPPVGTHISLSSMPGYVK
jgi:hypothetical protein